MKSTNNLSFSGRLVADAKTNDSKSYAQFRIAHNMGKNNPTAYMNFTQFSKNGRFETPIDFDLLKKGTPVLVNAYAKGKEYQNSKGETVSEIQWIVKTVELISEEDAEAEDTQE